MADYLFYWRNDTVARHHGGVLEHAAGEQLGKVQRGDTLWIVTYQSGTSVNQLPVMTNLIVYRVPITNAPQGIGIQSFVESVQTS